MTNNDMYNSVGKHNLINTLTNGLKDTIKDFVNQLDENAIKGEFVATHAPFILTSQIAKEFYRLNANSERSFTSNEVIMLLARVENNMLQELIRYFNINNN